MDNQRRRNRFVRGVIERRRCWRIWVLLAALVPAGFGSSSACLDRPIGSVPPVTTNSFVDKITQNAVDKVDLLFMIDNSVSMSDKQAILRLAIPDLVARLVNPVCIDSQGKPQGTPPAGAPCPQGQRREFNPIEDIHVALVSSSLGDAGANDYCAAAGPSHVPERVDLAHLMGSLPRGQDTGATAEGFLEWKASSTDPKEFSASFQRMVESVGENGCGWEASLESWYRFLVDPFPYRELARVRCPGSSSDAANCVQAASDGSDKILVDQTLLAQRKAFLRPDSLVAIIMLSDENDCSIAVGGSSWVVADGQRRMNRGSSACAEDPNSKCCYMCGARVPEGCREDAICDSDPSEDAIPDRMPRTLDGVNLRCFDQKRRFGNDFLYPTARYVNALKQPELCWNRPDLSLEGCPAADRIPNPLFSGGRDRSLVFLGGIVGVPWQAIASELDENNRPLRDPTKELRFKTSVELEADDTWSKILGSPGVRWQPATESRGEIAASPAVAPENPLMIESQSARPGVASGNPYNGREYDTSGRGALAGTAMDLEYACIFPLPTPRDCSSKDPRTEACDCYGTDLDRPLCEREPGNGSPGTMQYWAKAYPGTRQLQVLRDYGENSIVASICARNVDIGTRDTRTDFGYRPAMDAIVDRLKERLGDRCLPRALLTAEDDSVPCTLVETVPRPTSPCECDPSIARKDPDARVEALVRAQLSRQPGAPCGAADPECDEACLCEVLQVQEAANPDPEAALRVCREEEEASGVEGWCYLADTRDQKIGNAALVDGCPATQRQKLRFVGGGLQKNTTTFVACQGSSLAAQRAQ